MKENILFIICTIVFSILFLFFLEIFVRVLLPNINFQDTERSLFKKGAMGNNVGWNTNGKGVSFEKKVNIDSDGFRKMNSPSQY